MAVHAPAPRALADFVADVRADLDPIMDTCRCPGADWDGDDWVDAFTRGYHVARRNVDIDTALRDATSYANRAKLTAGAHARLHVSRRGRSRPRRVRRLHLLLPDRADDPDRRVRSP